MAAEAPAPQAPSHGLSASEVAAVMSANASWPWKADKTVWVSEHNALRADMDDLAAAIGALDAQLAAGKPLTAWQVRLNVGTSGRCYCSQRHTPGAAAPGARPRLRLLEWRARPTGTAARGARERRR